MISQYDDEVQAILFGYAHIYQHKGGRWIAELVPEMLDKFKDQKLPPGQRIYAGFDGLVSEYDGEIQRVNIGDEFSTRHDMEMWASFPHFHSAESAAAKIMYWLNTERMDLVAISQACAQDGRIYRARMALNPRKVIEKPKPTMWDQLLSSS